MTLVAGIDPGAYGAFAVYDTTTRRIISVHDMPVWFMTIGKTKRARVDSLAVAELFDFFNMMGVELLVIEAVGGRPRQGAAAGFAFGYGVGLIAMGAILSKIMIETIPPDKWKKLLNVPGKAKAGDDDIMARGMELFPHDRALFYTERGRKLVDRMEAAMLAKIGGDIVLRTMSERTDDVEYKLAYRNGGFGA